MSKQEFDAQKTAGEVFTRLQGVYKEIAGAQGLKGYGLIIPLVLAEVEEIRNDLNPLSGEQKKEIASRVLNLLINLPVVPEFIEARIFDIVIDWFVAFFNRSFGNTWIDAVRKIFPTGG